MGRRKQRYSVIDRGSGVWYYKLADWRGYRSSGIEISRSRSGSPTNKHEAELFALEQADLAELEREGSATLRAFLAPYYSADCPRCRRLAADGRAISDTHRAKQRRLLDTKVLTDQIADRNVRELRAGDFEDLKARWAAAGNGVRTINLTLAALSAAFSEAVHRGDLRYSPIATVGRARGEIKQERGIFTPAELKRMFIIRPDSWGYNPGETGDGKRQGRDWKPARAFALLIATIGERPSAILALDWRHYDGRTLTFPKTKDRRKSGRVVPLTSLAIDALEELREDRVRIADDDPIFCYDEDGARMGQTWYAKRFRRTMRVLGLPRLDAYGGVRVPYSLKYTLETELIDRGANPALVRDLMGHSHQRGSSETILTPVQARYRRQRAEKLEELLPVIESIFQ